MPAFRISGSPRTAARQLVELLTRDNILDEDGNVNLATVEAACDYAGGERTLEEEPRSPAATDGSTPTRKNETPESRSEQCTLEVSAPPADTSRNNSSEEGASTKDTHSPFPCRQN